MPQPLVAPLATSLAASRLKPWQRLLASTLAAIQVLPLATVATLATSGHANAQTQNTQTQYEYDAQGNLTRITDPRQKVTDQTPDNLDRLQQQQLPAPVAGRDRPTVYYSYNGQDKLTRVVDPRSNATSYSIDGLGNTWAQTSPDTGRSLAAFDELGQLLQWANKRNAIVTYDYDALNRPTTVTYSDGAAVLLRYDTFSTTPGYENYGRGHLTGLVEVDNDENLTVISKLFFTYDDQGRVTSRCQVFGGSALSSACPANSKLVYRWLNADGSDPGHLVGLTYPSGRLVDYTYDAQGHVTAITTTDPATNTTVPVVSSVSYKPLNVEAGEYGLNVVYFGDGATTPIQFMQREYDLDGRVSLFTVGYGAKGLTYTKTIFTPTYDEASRIQQILPSSGTGATYGYDDLNRLTSATVPSGSSTTTYTYDYDANGNRTLKTAGAASFSYGYPTTSNRLANVTSGSTTQSLTTDLTGNITVDPTTPVGQVAFSYDDRTTTPYGRLVGSQGPGGSWTYLHNYLGQRIRKKGENFTSGNGTVYPAANYVGSVETIFHYDLDGHLIAELDASTKAVKREYIWLGDTPVAIIAGTTPNAMVNATSNPAAVYYVHSDHLNTPRLVTDTAGNQRWKWAVLDEPFGAGAVSEAPSAQAAMTVSLRLPGQYADAETGVFYNYYRTYNPQTGRYLQSDPIGLGGGLNTYGYVVGNPVSHVDTLGLMPYVPALPDGPGGGGGGGIEPRQSSIGARGNNMAGVIVGGLVIGSAMVIADRIDTAKTKEKEQCKDNDGDDCKQKASDWELKQAGIDAHEVKKGLGQVSLFEICKCRSGGFAVKRKGCQGPIIFRL